MSSGIAVTISEKVAAAHAKTELAKIAMSEENQSLADSNILVIMLLSVGGMVMKLARGKLYRSRL